jgi:HAD superfamily hydrolase (TIGR01549 family)
MPDTIIFDIDGTLVDSNYLHLMAWSRAFAAVGVVVPSWRLHVYMGMGGDHLVAAAAGDAVEKAVGDEVRDRWRTAFDELIGEVRPFEDAVGTLEAFRRAGLKVVLATSGNEDHVDRSLEILEITRHDFPLVTSADVDATKPAGDLVGLALESVEGRVGVMVGDTAWDVKAALGADVQALGVLTGGVSEARLREAGALRVFEDVSALGRAVPEVLDLLGGTRAAG